MRKILFATLWAVSVYAYANSVVVDLGTQTLRLLDNKNRVVLFTHVSTGNKFHKTPKGVFRIIEKEREHKSNLYPLPSKKGEKRGGASMPYMLKFTNGGNAIHLGEVVFEGDRSIPVSHGCIRVPPEEAKILFDALNVGDKVIIGGKYDYDDDLFNPRLVKNGEDEVVIIEKDGTFDPKEGEEADLNIAFVEITDEEGE